MDSSVLTHISHADLYAVGACEGGVHEVWVELGCQTVVAVADALKVSGDNWSFVTESAGLDGGCGNGDGDGHGDGCNGNGFGNGFGNGNGYGFSDGGGGNGSGSDGDGLGDGNGLGFGFGDGGYHE